MRRWLLFFVGVFLFCLVFAGLRPVFSHWLVVTAEVQSGTLREVIPAWGIVLGAETVYYAQYFGKVIPLVSDGQRVRANAIVCEILDEAEAATAKLRQTNLASAVAGVGRDLLQQEITDLELAIKRAEQILREAILQGDKTRIEAIEKQLRALHEDLQAAHKALAVETVPTPVELDPGAYSRLVRAPVAGVIKFSGDGYESLTVDMVRGLTREEIEAKRKPAWQVADGKVIGVGAPLFQLDPGHELWGYLILPGEPFYEFSVGDEVVVCIPQLGDQHIAAVVEDMDGRETQTALEVKFMNYATELLEWRSGPVEIVSSVYKGAIVPKTALVSRHGALGVYLQSEGDYLFTMVRKIGEVGDRVAVSGIPIGADVVVNPGLLERLGIGPN